MPYMWWRVWLDDQRRTWAEPFSSGDPAEAKRRHADDLRFEWAAGLKAPLVSDLNFSNEKGDMAVVRDGSRREDAADRAYTSVGADQVSTQVKAEVQPAEPGSSPGGSTSPVFRELPF